MHLKKTLLPCLVGLTIWFPAFASPSADSQVLLAGHRFHVEIVANEAARERGLMHRTHLAADHGMLFIYPDAQIRLFWMKNTLIPLDILFFDAHKRFINVSADTPPCKADPCPTYASTAPARYVLELKAGTAKHLSLHAGDIFKILR